MSNVSLGGGGGKILLISHQLHVGSMVDRPETSIFIFKYNENAN